MLSPHFWDCDICGSLKTSCKGIYIKINMVDGTGGGTPARLNLCAACYASLNVPDKVIDYVKYSHEDAVGWAKHLSRTLIRDELDAANQTIDGLREREAAWEQAREVAIAWADNPYIRGNMATVSAAEIREAMPPKPTEKKEVKV
jgi:hypothetical protein